MYTAKQAHDFAKTLPISAEKQHATGVQLALLADRGHESPEAALQSIKAGKRAATKDIKAAKSALLQLGFKDLICHHGAFISAYGWQLNNTPFGNIDSHGNGRYQVAQIDQNSGKWVDAHDNPLPV